jgi:hypothetical protein
MSGSGPGAQGVRLGESRKVGDNRSMQLIEELQRQLAGEQSLFRAQLLREDIARLTRLVELARSTPEFAAFRQAALRIGWTQGDARTQELAGPLDDLLGAVHAYCGGMSDAAQQARIGEAWLALHRLRMERLVGCLSTPVPKPLD